MRRALAMLVVGLLLAPVAAGAKVRVDRKGPRVSPTTATDWLRHPDEARSYQESWTAILRSHAVANGCHVVVANRVGHEAEPGGDGLQFWGHSMVIDPMGGVLAEAGEQDEALLVQSCDLAAAEEARRGWPFFRDRRVDAYGPLTRLWRDEEGQL